MESKEFKIIPSLDSSGLKEKAKVPKQEKKSSRKIQNSNAIIFLLIFGSFLTLLIAITFLPLSSSLKTLGLLIGSFLIFDLHQSIKRQLKELED